MNCLSPLQGEIHDTDLPGVKTPGLVLKSLRDNKPAVLSQTTDGTYWTHETNTAPRLFRLLPDAAE